MLIRFQARIRRRRHRLDHRALPFVAAISSTIFACAQPAEETPTIRLVDLFPEATISTATTASGTTEAPATTSSWRFSEEDGDPTEPFAATQGWQAGTGVTELGVREGRLVGRSTTDFPILHVEPAPHSDPRDLLHSIELTMRASAGNKVSLSFSDSEDLIWPRIVGMAGTFPWTAAAELQPDGESNAYTVRPGSDIAAADIRHLLLRPTDAEGADFEIESVRLVFRKEHLATTPAGIGWQGMANIYRETLTTHASEVANFTVKLPQKPWIDLAVASIEDGPVTFRITLTGDGTDSGETVLERTLTSPHRWEPVAVDLENFAGKTVNLALRIDAERPGSLGFWGTPVVRSRGAEPARGSTENGSPPPRGVIVIVGDTLRSDHLNLWGYDRETAPVLTGLAEAGAWAQDCITQATWTKVSVPSIFTSRYPLSHGVHEIVDRLPASAVTLAEVFRDAGYATFGMSSIPFTGRATNLHQGYEEFHESGSLGEGTRAKTARTYVDRLLTWLDRRHDTPFFVFLHVADPHSPYLPYAPYDTLWGQPGDAEEYQELQNKAREFIADPLMKRFGMPERQELVEAGVDPKHYVAFEHDAYDGSIRGMDVEIGRVVERLDQLGIAEDTLIAFISDHGTEFLDHNRHFHGHSVYGELNRVPFILSGPGVPAGVVIPETIQTLDLMPTILELSGLDAPEGLQGQSLVSRMTSLAEEGEAANRPRPRPAFTERAESGDSDALERGAAGESYSIVLDGWKLIHNPVRAEEHPEFELFDHSADPLNLHNLAAEHPERVQQLATQLAAWRESAAAARLPSDDTLTEGMSQEDLERLRSLGYVQ